MAKITKAFGKVVSVVKGAARSTKKSVVRTVDVAKQKSAIAHKQTALREMYEAIGKYICTSCADGTLRLNGSGVAGNVACKDQLAEFLVLEAEFKDEIERMEKMLYWLQTHEVKVNTSPVVDGETVEEPAQSEPAQTQEESTVTDDAPTAQEPAKEEQAQAKTE